MPTNLQIDYMKYYNYLVKRWKNAQKHDIFWILRGRASPMLGAKGG